MKNILKFFLLAGIVLTSFAVNAQSHKPAQRTPPTPEQRAERRTAVLKDKLLLSEEQKTKVYQAILKLEKQRVNDQKQMKANREAYETELGTILTPEQHEKYEAMKDQHKQDIKKRAEEHRNNQKLQESTTDDKTQPQEQK